MHHHCLFECVRVMWTLRAPSVLYPRPQLQHRHMLSGSAMKSSLGLYLLRLQKSFIESSHPCLTSDLSVSHVSSPLYPSHCTLYQRHSGVPNVTSIPSIVKTSSVSCRMTSCGCTVLVLSCTCVHRICIHVYNLFQYLEFLELWVFAPVAFALASFLSSHDLNACLHLHGSY